jgi:hypothetical protein
MGTLAVTAPARSRSQNVTNSVMYLAQADLDDGVLGGGRGDQRPEEAPARLQAGHAGDLVLQAWMISA